MSDLIKYSIEIPINSSVNVLYKRLSTPSGLAEWFADNVNLKNNVFTFFWDDSDQSAKILKKKSNKFVQFKWLDDDLLIQIFPILVMTIFYFSGLGPDLPLTLEGN